jgi:hypothetical protein
MTLSIDQAISRARMIEKSYLGSAEATLEDYPESACQHSLNAQAIRMLADIVGAQELQKKIDQRKANQ